MRKVRKVVVEDVSPLEQLFNEWFRQSQPTPERFDQSPFGPPANARPTPPRYVTYATYGVCEDPILA